MPYTFKCSQYHFFQFSLVSFSLLLLKMSFKCSININQQSKDEPLICAISGVANDHVNVFFQDRPIIIIFFFLIT